MLNLRNWKKVIETDIGKVITTPEEARELSTIYESEIKLNKNFFDVLEKESILRDKIEPMTTGLYKDYLNKSKRV